MEYTTTHRIPTTSDHTSPSQRPLFVSPNDSELRKSYFPPTLNISQGCELAGPDFVALARAYGGSGVRIGGGEGVLKDGEVTETVAAAMGSTGLFVIHAIIDPDLKADMAKFIDGS